MRHLLSATIASLLLVSLHSWAQQPDERRVLATELVALVDYTAMYGEALKQCVNPDGYKADALAQFQADPRAFGGVSPQSAYWPEAEMVFAKYRETMCRYLEPGALARFMAEQYARRMSVDELRSSIAFFSSPSGKRYQQATLGASNEFQVFAQKKMQELQLKAYEAIAADLDALGKKYRRDPK
jgi:hypothetical protein